MTDNKKIHKILKYVCSLPLDVGSIDTRKIALETNFPISETNILVRQIINNGDAVDCTTDGSPNSVEILIIRNTRDAYTSDKYLKAESKERTERLKKIFNFNIQNLIYPIVVIIIATVILYFFLKKWKRRIYTQLSEIIKKYKR